MILREIQLGDEIEALRAHEELKADDFQFLLFYESGMNWADFIKIHDDYKNKPASEGKVNSSFLFAVDEDQIIGRASIRHSLNDWLLNYGGHIGYAVRPGFRQKGYATEILKQSLEYCRQLGLDRALVTCNDNNEASARTIEKCGGVLENKILEKIETGERLVRRYWIDL
jgi:predicted acetyltransferase